MCEVKELPETYQPLTTLVVCISYSLCSLIWRTPRIFLWVPVRYPPNIGRFASAQLSSRGEQISDSFFV